MKKILSKVTLSLLLAVSVLGISNSVSVEAANSSEVDSSGELTKDQLEEMNEALEELKEKANEKLDKGEEEFTVSTDVSFQDEPLEMEFDADEVKENSQSTKSNQATTKAAVQEKNFSHKIKNTAGFNFSHKVSGSFTYKSGDVKKYSADSDLTGPLYSKSHSTKVDRIDDSVAKVRSSGTFKALKYAPVEYKTRVDIGLYGSGTYRVLETSIK